MSEHTPLTEAEIEALCFCDDVHDCRTRADSDRLKAACEANRDRVEAILAARTSTASADERDRQGLGQRITDLLNQHWPNSGVNGHYLADLLREGDDHA